MPVNKNRFKDYYRKEHCLVTLTETVLFAPSQPLSRKVRCIEIVYVPLTQNVSCIFKIFKHSQHKMKYINFIRRFFFGLYFEQNRIHTRSYRSENFICITWKWRLTVAQLAEEVGLSSSPCWTRLKRLETLKLLKDIR